MLSPIRTITVDYTSGGSLAAEGGAADKGVCRDGTMAALVPTAGADVRTRTYSCDKWGKRCITCQNGVKFAATAGAVQCSVCNACAGTGQETKTACTSSSDAVCRCQADFFGDGTTCTARGQLSCDWEGDGECDVPLHCPEGTDTADCENQSSCPSHSHQSSDGSGCTCDIGYSVNSAGTACVRCAYEGNGICDVPTLCPAGTDLADCSGAVQCPVHSTGGNAATGDCMCDAGYHGLIIGSPVAPYYTGNCNDLDTKPVKPLADGACPTNHTTTYAFFDIAATGAKLLDASAPGPKEVRLPFDFPWYGREETAITVGVDGLITFGATAHPAGVPVASPNRCLARASAQESTTTTTMVS